MAFYTGIFSLLLTISAIGRFGLYSGGIFAITLFSYWRLVDSSMSALLLAGFPIALNAAVWFAVLSHSLSSSGQAIDSHSLSSSGQAIEFPWRRGRRRDKYGTREEEEILKRHKRLNELPLPLSSVDLELPLYERDRSWSAAPDEDDDEEGVEVGKRLPRQAIEALMRRRSMSR